MAEEHSAFQYEVRPPVLGQPMSNLIDEVLCMVASASNILLENITTL